MTDWSQKKFLVTGGAGFVGSHFCDLALKKGATVLALDNLETGSEFFLKEAQNSLKFSLEKADIRDGENLAKIFSKFRPDWCVHFAANADVRKGFDRPLRDFQYNTQGTVHVLEACRQSGCKKILFSSTGSVYGEHKEFPTPETASFPEQTSLYGASKLAGEAMISAYCHGYQFTGLVFRFVSILGPRYTHGHVFDFVKKLLRNPQKIEVLGNGKQTKSYLHVFDLMRGLEMGINFVESKAPSFHVFNIGHHQTLTVDQSLDYICAKMNLHPERSYTGGIRGWIGDSPLIHLCTKKLQALGWHETQSLEKSVQDTVEYLLENKFLLERDS